LTWSLTPAAAAAPSASANLLSPPLRKNVTLLVPPTEIINSKVEVALAPFVEDMKNNKKPYLILVRGKQAFFKNSSNYFVGIFIGINKGTAIFLSILKSLNDPCEEGRSVGFYHRNTSMARKQEILEDLKLPIISQDKKLLCVVATVSLGRILYQTWAKDSNNCIWLGVGVDIRVANCVVFGLSETIEDLLQEGGRSMRGGDLETQGERGLTFFLHKGSLGEFNLTTLVKAPNLALKYLNSGFQKGWQNWLVISCASIE
jgi:hypothetical protein